MNLSPSLSYSVHKLSVGCFDPSQPRRITSGLKTMFSLSPIYSARKSSTQKLFKNHKISPDTNLQKPDTNVKHRIFEELVLSVLRLLKKAH